MLIWSDVENGFGLEGFYNEGRRLLTEAREAFPRNSVLPQYFGDAWSQETNNDDDNDDVADSNWDWVEPQQRAMKGLEEVIRFWCEQRQAPDGQFGGGWGDDVEMWRNWIPVLLGFKISYYGTSPIQLILLN